MQSMTNVLRVVEGLFSSTIRKLYPSFSQLKGSVQSSSGKFGDYKSNAAVQISQVTLAHQLMQSKEKTQIITFIGAIMCITFCTTLVCEMCSIVLVVPRHSCTHMKAWNKTIPSLIACLYRYRLRRWKISKLLCLRGVCFIFLLDVEVPGSERSSKTGSSCHCWKTGKHRAIS